QSSRTTSLRCRTGTMPADVIKASQSPIGTAHNKERFADHLGREIISRLRDLIVMSHNLPRAREDFSSLRVEHLPIVVQRRRKRPRARYIRVDSKQVFRNFHERFLNDRAPFYGTSTVLSRRTFLKTTRSRVLIRIPALATDTI